MEAVLMAHLKYGKMQGSVEAVVSSGLLLALLCVLQNGNSTRIRTASVGGSAQET